MPMPMPIYQRPRQQPLEFQLEYYTALARFWCSVVARYPHPENRYFASVYTRELRRVEHELNNGGDEEE